MPNLYWPHLRVPRSSRRRAKRRVGRWMRAANASRTHLVVSHGHCLDGVGSAIIALRTFGKENVGVAYVQPTDMAEILTALRQVASHGRTLLVADLSLQKEQYPAIVEACADLKAKGWRIEWRDHHHKQWEGLDLAELRRHVHVLEVNADATESGASLMQKGLAPNDAFAARLAETIRDRDLWWNRNPDSQELEFALSELGTPRFTALYLAARATDPVLLPAVAAAAQRERAGQKAVLDRILAGSRTWGEGQSKVAIVYGWLPKNTGLHELVDGGAAIAVNVRPNGKMSLRSRKDAPVCHLVAQRFGGGGHPNASGGDLGLKGLAFIAYVLRRGKVARVTRVAEAAQEALATLARDARTPGAAAAAAKATPQEGEPQEPASRDAAARRKGTKGRSKGRGPRKGKGPKA